MTEEQIDFARHALGLNSRRNQSFRNHFVAGLRDLNAWMAMVAQGDAVRDMREKLPYGGDDLFHLTRQGAEKVLRAGESLCPEHFPRSAA